ncbi:PAS domain S-box protein [Allocoleopsis sp.]|uniref:PAS domain S-box protein n=1 Tax=Allocoleopsis sp. TaxID=3088169 RepID=UPI002FD1EF74
MAEPIQEVFWLTSADYQQLLYVSPAFETIWGRRLESLYTYPGGHLQLMVDSIHPSDREHFVAAFAQPLQYEYKAEYRIVRPDSSIRWMRSRCFPIRNSFGETWAIAGLSEDITESKRAEELLHQRQQEFTALVEHSPDIISRFDRQLRHLYVNPALELATGMSTQEFIGKTHRELGMPQELISLWEPSIQRVFQTRQSDEHEFSYLTPQGWNYYQSRLFPEFAADGSVETVLAICRDLTLHKQTEEALRESEQRFRTVFEFAPIGIALIDTQGQLFASNRAFQELIGYTKEELQNQPFTQFTHPDDRDASLNLFQELLARQRTGVFQEKRYCRKDGGIVWGKVAVSAVFNPNGVFQYAIAMIQDITAQKQAQLELLNAYEQLEKRVTERTTELEQANALLQQEIAERSRVQQALQVQKDFLQAVLDTNPNVIFVKDQDGKIVLANLAFAELYGMKVEDLLGKTDAEIHPNQADVERFEREDRAAFQTNQTIVVSETTFITPNNSVRYINGIKKPLFLPNEQTCLVLAVGTDITELKQAQEEVKAQKEFLQAVLDTNPSLIFVKDSEGTIILANQAYADLWGTTVADLLGKKDADFQPNFAEIEKYQSEDRVVSSNREQVFIPEEAHTTATGELRWFQIIKRPIFSREDQVALVLGVCTDITERKLVAEALNTQKEFLQTVLDSTPNLIWVKDREDKIVLANCALADFFETTVEDLLGKTNSELYANPADVEHCMAQDREVLSTLREKIIPEEALPTPSGKVRWFQTIKKPICSSEGQVNQVLGVSTDITEHKRSQEELKAQKEFLQTVLDTNPNLIYVKDREGKYLLANLALADFYGIPLEEVLGHTNAELTPYPAEAQQLCAQEEEVLTTLQQKFILEQASHTPSGELRWYQILKKPLFSKEGQVPQLFAVCNDITARKQAEEQLRHSEERLRLALDAARMANWHRNLETGVMITGSPNFERLYGWAIGSYDGSYDTYLQRIHPEDRDVVHAYMHHSLEIEADRDIEFRIVLPDGTIRWIETKGRVIYGEMGKPVTLSGISLDITQRKQAEEQLRHHENQLSLALDAARMGFWDWNIQTETVTWSDNFKRLFGLDPNNDNHSYETFVAMLHPDDREHVHQASERSFQGEGEGDIEFRIVLPDGSIRWIQSKYQVYYDETGKPIRRTGIDLDITERKQAETQIKESLREKEVLLQEIHHRVKNNLQVISSLLDLQSQYIDDSAMLEAFRESHNRIRSMALIHEQLYQSKDCAKINFSEYITSLTNDLFRAYGVHPGQITLELEIEEVTLNINTAIPCGLIISELVSNALKHAFPQGRAGIIKVALYSDADNQLTLQVTDNGIGFPEDSEFRTVKSLGLQLVSVLANQLEGTLELDRRLGTQFKITFFEISH